MNKNFNELQVEIGKTARNDFVSSKQHELLPKQIAYACKTGIDTAIAFWASLNFSRKGPCKVLIVGEGDSYPAAIVAKHKLQKVLESPFIEVMTPHYAIRKLALCLYSFKLVAHPPVYDMVIAISYSGKSPEILEVYNYCTSAKIPFRLITCGEYQEVSSNYPDCGKENIFCFPHNDDAEEGLLSMAATLVPLFPFIAHPNAFDVTTQTSYMFNLANAKMFVDNLDTSQIANSLRRSPIVHIFYDSFTEATAVDLDNKFTKSGIASVVMHEKKDFSHGRYSTLYKNRFGLVINLTQKKETDNKVTYGYRYEALLEDFLRKICDYSSAFYMEIPIVNYRVFPYNEDPLETKAYLANFKGLAIVPYLIAALGEELGIDISRPITPLLPQIPFSEEVDALRNYNGSF